MKYDIMKNNLAMPILWLYIFVVMCMQTVFMGGELNVMTAILYVVISLGVSFLLMYIIGKIQKLTGDWTNRQMWISVSLIFGVTLIIYTLSVIFLNSNLHPDSIVQWKQAESGVYDTWHPPLHTILFFTIPMKLGLGKYGIMLLQTLYFSMAFTYLSYVLISSKISKIWLAISCLLVWSSPYMMVLMWRPLKDVAFMIFATLLFGYVVRIVHSNGEWLDKKKNIILFAAAFVCCQTMRHNGILFTLPLGLIMLFYIVKKWNVRIYAIIAIILCLVSVRCLYLGINAEKADMRIVETIGMPLTVWGNVMKNEPEALPEETQKFMYEIASKDMYENEYITGDFNSIKWKNSILNSDLDFDRIDELGIGEVLKYTYQCFRYAPESSYDAIVFLTREVWKLLPEDGDMPNAQVIQKLERLESRLHINIYPVKAVLASYGYINLALIAVCIYLLSRKRYSFIYCLPLLCYNFGTMLLLTAHHDYRFFLINIPIFTATVYLSLKDNKTWSKENPATDKL